MSEVRPPVESTLVDLDQDLPNPAPLKRWGVILAIGALVTGALGLDANGYLVPAAVALVLASLLWLGKGGALVRLVSLINLASGVLLVAVLALGGFLGDRRLDVSGVSLLVNLATGGPALSLVAPGVLLGMRPGKPLSAWFGGLHQGEAAR